MRLSDTSTASRDAKRALAAADAGLEAAMFRMNVLGLQSTSKCFTTAAVDPATGTDPETGGTPSAGECAGVADDLGNNSSYTYYVTPGAPGRGRLRRAFPCITPTRRERSPSRSVA